MNRGILYFTAGQMLSLAVIGWLWNENRSLRAESAAERSRHDGRLADTRAGGRDPAHGMPAPNRPGRDDPAGGRDTRGGWTEKARKPGAKLPDRFPRGVADTTARRDPAGAGRDLPAPQGKSRTSLVMAPGQSGTAGARSLLKNGTFDKEPAPWTCEQGRIAPDPEDPGNSVLEITPGGKRFSLSQPFRRTPATENLRLTFRVKTESGSDRIPGFVGIHLSDEHGTPVTTTAAKIKDPSGWNTLTLDLSWNRPGAKGSIKIDGSNPGGKLWIDDVKLVETSSPGSTGGQ